MKRKYVFYLSITWCKQSEMYSLDQKNKWGSKIIIFLKKKVLKVNLTKSSFVEEFASGVCLYKTHQC